MTNGDRAMAQLMMDGGSNVGGVLLRRKQKQAQRNPAMIETAYHHIEELPSGPLMNSSRTEK
jgi:hypothetical protein